MAIFYELTRTFCPNFAIYFFITNLLMLCLSQIEAHAFHAYPQSQRMEPVYPSVLYVKQDIYRLEIMAMIYYGLFSFMQTGIFGYGMFLAFGLSALPFLMSITRIQEGQYKKSLGYLLLVCGVILGLLMLRVWAPGWFHPFVPKFGLQCGLFDRQ